MHSPFFRIGWSIAVPLQIIVSTLILKATKKSVSAAMFWKLLVGTVILLGYGYADETRLMDRMSGFAIGARGRFVILSEIFMRVPIGSGGDWIEAVKSFTRRCA